MVNTAMDLNVFFNPNFIKKNLIGKVIRLKCYRLICNGHRDLLTKYSVYLKALK